MSTVFATVSTPGPPGAAGPPGYSPKFIVASGPPGAGTGNNGDMYIDSSNGNVYGPKTAGAWGGVVANIKGPTGPTGATGYSPQYIVAAGAPAAGTGNNGDMYIDSSTSNVYGPKTAGAWGAVACNIKGSPGTAGAQGPPGVAYTPRGAWSAAITYAQGDEVTDVSVLYIALQGSNLNHVPASSPTWWQPVGTGGSSQTPWLSNIDGGGFNLSHVAAINVGNTVTPVAPVHVVGSFSGAAFPGIVVANSSPTVGSSVAVTFAVGNTGSTVTGAISNLAESATAAAIIFSTYNSGLLERVRITAAGNVGINWSTPSDWLMVRPSSGQAGITIQNKAQSATDEATLSLMHNASGYGTRLCLRDADGGLHIDTQNGGTWKTNVLVIASATGNVGIGTTAPNAHLGIDTPYSAAVTHAIFSSPYVNGGDYQQLLFSYAQTDTSSQAGIRGIRYVTGDYGASLAFVCSSNVSPGTLTERMRITAAGKVGIGTAAPFEALQISGALRIGSGAIPANGFNFSQDGSGYLRLQYMNSATIYSEILTVSYAGGLGIGKGAAAPAYALDVVGDCNITGTYRVNGTAIGSGGSGITAKSIVTGSRVAGTSYQNSTGKSMFVTIVASVVATGYMQLWTDTGNPPSAVACAVTNVNGGAAAVYSVCGWVLSGHFYQLNTPGATIQSWVEWT